MKTTLVLLCLLVVVYGFEDKSLQQHKDLIEEKVQVGKGVINYFISNIEEKVQVGMGVINHFISNILEKDSIQDLCSKFAGWVLGNIINAIFFTLQ